MTETKIKIRGKKCSLFLNADSFKAMGKVDEILIRNTEGTIIAWATLFPNFLSLPITEKISDMRNWAKSYVTYSKWRGEIIDEEIKQMAEGKIKA